MKNNTQSGLKELIPFIPQNGQMPDPYAPRNFLEAAYATPMYQIGSAIGNTEANTSLGGIVEGAVKGSSDYQDYMRKRGDAEMKRQLTQVDVARGENVRPNMYDAMMGDEQSMRTIASNDPELFYKIKDFQRSSEYNTIIDQMKNMQAGQFMGFQAGGEAPISPEIYNQQRQEYGQRLTDYKFPEYIAKLNQINEAFNKIPYGTNIPGLGKFEQKFSDFLPLFKSFGKDAKRYASNALRLNQVLMELSNELKSKQYGAALSTAEITGFLQAQGSGDENTIRAWARDRLNENVNSFERYRSSLHPRVQQSIEKSFPRDTNSISRAKSLSDEIYQKEQTYLSQEFGEEPTIAQTMSQSAGVYGQQPPQAQLPPRPQAQDLPPSQLDTIQDEGSLQTKGGLSFTELAELQEAMNDPATPQEVKAIAQQTLSRLGY